MPLGDNRIKVNGIEACFPKLHLPISPKRHDRQIPVPACMTRRLAQEVRIRDWAVLCGIRHKIGMSLLALGGFFYIGEEMDFDFVLAALQRFADIRFMAAEAIVSLQYRLGVDFDFSHRVEIINICLLYTSPSPRDRQKSRMP